MNSSRAQEIKKSAIERQKESESARAGARENEQKRQRMGGSRVKERCVDLYSVYMCVGERSK